MTVLDFIRLTRASLVMLLIAVVAGAGLAFVATFLVPRSYEAKSTGYVMVGGTETPTEVLDGSEVAQERAAAYLPLITSRRVAEQIVQTSTTGLTVEDIEDNLQASVARGSALIVITATATSPEAAAELANSALTATAEVVRQIEGEASAVQVIALESALVPERPAAPSVPQYVLIGALAGLVIGYAIAFLRRATDTKVRTQADVTELTAGGVLGILPRTGSFKGRSRREDPRDPRAAESIRQLRTNLRFVSVDRPPRAIVVTSASPGEGKSTVSSALARALAAAGQPTVLIDADLRKPTQSAIFDLDGSIGLTQLLSGQVDLATAVRPGSVDGLYVLPAGPIPPNPSELLGSGRMAQLIKELSAHYFVILDAPPLLPVTDASLLSTVVDGTILVVHVGATRKDQLSAARGMLQRVKANLLGTVMNVAPGKGVGTDHYGFGYGGYQYGAGAYGTLPSSPASAPASAFIPPSEVSRGGRPDEGANAPVPLRRAAGGGS